MKAAWIAVVILLVAVALGVALWFTLPALRSLREGGPSPSPTPLTNNPFDQPDLVNPFSSDSTYQNPFENVNANEQPYQNPFSNL